MAGQKAKSTAKKATKSKAGSAATGKPRSNKAGAITARKKAAKKAVTEGAAQKKVKLPAVKKMAKPAAKMEPPVMLPKSDDTRQTKAKLSPEERYRMVETAAYFIAEQRGFQGRSDEHWTAAELQIAAKLGQ